MDTRKNAVPPFWMALAKRRRFAPPCYVALSMAVLLILTAPAPAQIVTATVPAVGTPVAATVNPDTNKIYIANQLGQNVQVINGATNSSTVINTPGKGPRSIHPEKAPGPLGPQPIHRGGTMKSKTLTLITAMTLFAATLAVPVRLVAQVVPTPGSSQARSAMADPEEGADSCSIAGLRGTYIVSLNGFTTANHQPDPTGSISKFAPVMVIGTFVMQSRMYVRI
jgi:hypothetical protein